MLEKRICFQVIQAASAAFLISARRRLGKGPIDSWAELLGLRGEVERKDFVALVNNKWPGANGERLTARMNNTRLEDVKDKKTGLPV